jgi:hypothetical protein
MQIDYLCIEDTKVGSMQGNKAVSRNKSTRPRRHASQDICYAALDSGWDSMLLPAHVEQPKSLRLLPTLGIFSLPQTGFQFARSGPSTQKGKLNEKVPIREGHLKPPQKRNAVRLSYCTYISFSISLTVFRDRSIVANLHLQGGLNCLVLKGVKCGLGSSLHWYTTVFGS